ncbi:uncharacterized protein LOC135822960 [Sycon ciliatum]|uniref:uncharacterized protein LOC135822960 n=1 Tax=Sycon ciliatum TaxID=27933 RepID=UPI0031F717FB
MATTNSPVCDRCEESPALFECNTCSPGDEVFYLCNGCHSLIHVGKFKSHAVISLLDKAKQSIHGCVERLQEKDDLIAGQLDRANNAKKQLQDCEIMENNEEGKRVVRKFVVTDDITLLNGVVCADDAFYRPVTHPCWSHIAETVGLGNVKMRNLTPRAVKERAERIVRQHRAADCYKHRQSGTPETYAAKDRLLEQAAELFDEARCNKEARRSGIGHRYKPEDGAAVESPAARALRSPLLSPGDKRKPDEQVPTADAVATSILLPPVGGELKRPRLLDGNTVSEVIQYLKERDEFAEARRWEELRLEREKFEASKAEREQMMTIMSKLLDKLQ